jgi:hypothetical protein
MAVVDALFTYYCIDVQTMLFVAKFYKERDFKLLPTSLLIIAMNAFLRTPFSYLGNNRSFSLFRTNFDLQFLIRLL